MTDFGEGKRHVERGGNSSDLVQGTPEYAGAVDAERRTSKGRWTPYASPKDTSSRVSPLLPISAAGRGVGRLDEPDGDNVFAKCVLAIVILTFIGWAVGKHSHDSQMPPQLPAQQLQPVQPAGASPPPGTYQAPDATATPPDTSTQMAPPDASPAYTPPQTDQTPPHSPDSSTENTSSQTTIDRFGCPSPAIPPLIGDSLLSDAQLKDAQAFGQQFANASNTYEECLTTVMKHSLSPSDREDAYEAYEKSHNAQLDVKKDFDTAAQRVSGQTASGN
jgi:hypothetical protein